MPSPRRRTLLACWRRAPLPHSSQSIGVRGCRPVDGFGADMDRLVACRRVTLYCSALSSSYLHGSMWALPSLQCLVESHAGFHSQAVSSWHTMQATFRTPQHLTVSQQLLYHGRHLCHGLLATTVHLQAIVVQLATVGCLGHGLHMAAGLSVISPCCVAV